MRNSILAEAMLEPGLDERHAAGVIQYFAFDDGEINERGIAEVVLHLQLQ